MGPARSTRSGRANRIARSAYRRAMQRLIAQAAAAAPELPRPEPFDHYLFEQPWPLSISLAALGLVILFALNARGEARKGLIAGLGFVGIGGIVVALAQFVETDREKIVRLSREVIRLTIESDVAGVRPLVAPDLRVGTIDRDGFNLNRDQFLGIVTNLPVAGIRDWSSSPKAGSIDGPNTGRVDYRVRVATSGGMYSGPMPTVWRFTWRQSREGEWTLIDLACISFFGEPPNAHFLSRSNRFAN